MVIRSARKEISANVTVRCFDGTVIEQVEKMKYLGVIIIDSKLRFVDYCDYLLKKGWKKMFFK